MTLLDCDPVSHPGRLKPTKHCQNIIGISPKGGVIIPKHAVIVVRDLTKTNTAQ